MEVQLTEYEKRIYTRKTIIEIDDDIFMYQLDYPISEYYAYDDYYGDTHKYILLPLKSMNDNLNLPSLIKYLYDSFVLNKESNRDTFYTTLKFSVFIINYRDFCIKNNLSILSYPLIKKELFKLGKSIKIYNSGEYYTYDIRFIKIDAKSLIIKINEIIKDKIY